MIKHGFKSAQTSNFIYNFCKNKCDFSVTDSMTRTPIVRNQYNNVQQSKVYSRFPQKVKEFELPSSGVVSSSLSSRIGFVSWYLGMIKSRPIITKSVTCSLIYTAADLSSQVLVNRFTPKQIGNLALLNGRKVLCFVWSFVKFLVS